MRTSSPIACVLAVCLLGSGSAVAQTVFATDLTARGIVRALHRPVLSSEITARVERLPVRAGEPFSKGDVLVSFDCARHKAERSRARAQLAAARAKLESDRELAALKSIAALEVTLSEARVGEAAAAVRVADLAVSRCRIRAPYDGRVVQVRVQEHQSVSEQQELIEIVDTARLEIEFVAQGSWLGWLRAGQALELAVDETGETVVAEVATTGATIDPVSQSISVRASITTSDAGLVPGMSGTVRFVN